MTIFEHFIKVEENVSKIYEENLPLLQQASAMGLGLHGRSFSGNKPMSQFHRDGMGNIIDFDHDGVPDSSDFYIGEGQFDPQSFD